MIIFISVVSGVSNTFQSCLLSLNPFSDCNARVRAGRGKQDDEKSLGARLTTFRKWRIYIGYIKFTSVFKSVQISVKGFSKNCVGFISSSHLQAMTMAMKNI